MVILWEIFNKKHKIKEDIMLYKNLDYFELFIYILYIFFLKLKKILFFLIIPFKIIFNFSKIFFLILIIFKIEKSKKIFVDILAVFYDMAYQEYELNHRLLMNYYLFFALVSTKKIEFSQGNYFNF